MYTNHSALKYLVNKPVLGGKICRWLLLFQEFDFEVVVKPSRLNFGPVLDFYQFRQYYLRILSEIITCTTIKQKRQ